MTNKQALREELSNPAIGNKDHLRKIALALLDELEAAQSYAKERDEENQDLMLTIGRLRVERETIESERDNALCELLPGVQYMDPPDGGCVNPMEQVRRMVADYRERIAELEEREVTLPQVLDVHPLGPQSAKMFWAFKRDVVNECADRIRAAGIRINGEG